MQTVVSLLLLLISLNSMSAPIIKVNLDETYYLINEVEYMLDSEHHHNINTIQNVHTWSPITSSNINFSFIEANLWLHFTLQAQSDGQWRLDTPYPLLDSYENYSFINNKALPPVITGDSRPFSSRAINHPNYVVPYDLKKNDLLDVYLKVDTKGASEVPLKLISKENFESENKFRVFLLGWMNGILLVMICYNLALYFFLRDSIFIIYCLTVLGYLIGTALYNGTAFQYIWPNQPHLNETLYPIINAFYHFINVVFIIMILNIINRPKILKYAFYSILGSSGLLIPLSFFLDYETIIPFEVIVALILNILGFSTGVFYSIKGEKTAMFFTLAWGLYILAMLIANFRTLGYLPVNWFTLYMYQIGVFIQVSVLSIALADRIERQKTKSIEILQRYKYLYDNTLSGLFTLDKKGIITNTNPAFRKMLGYDNKEELLSRSKENHRLYFHEDIDTPKSIFRVLSTKGYIFDIETQIKNKHGKLIWFSISVQAIKNKDGKLTSYQGSAINIQARKLSEENKRKAMEERMFAMEHLVVGICHEINTPLGISSTAINHLREDIALLNQFFTSNTLTKTIFSQRLDIKDEAINIINENLSRINILISQFKEVSVLQKGYKYHQGNMNHILEEVELVLSQKIGPENIKIHCNDKIIFTGYPRAIHDMIHNLYTNSISHGIENKNNLIKIDIYARIIKNEIEIRVHDNGIGIENKRIRDVFNPFYTSKRGSNGSIGLGLFQVFNIATQLLDGSIEVKNINPGVEFTISFPIIIKPIENRGDGIINTSFQLPNRNVI